MEQLRLTGWMTIFGALAVLATGVAWRVAAVAVGPISTPPFWTTIGPVSTPSSGRR